MHDETTHKLVNGLRQDSIGHMPLASAAAVFEVRLRVPCLATGALPGSLGGRLAGPAIDQARRYHVSARSIPTVRGSPTKLTVTLENCEASKA